MDCNENMLYFLIASGLINIFCAIITTVGCKRITKAVDNHYLFVEANSVAVDKYNDEVEIHNNNIYEDIGYQPYDESSEEVFNDYSDEYNLEFSLEMKEERYSSEDQDVITQEEGVLEEDLLEDNDEEIIRAARERKDKTFKKTINKLGNYVKTVESLLSENENEVFKKLHNILTKLENLDEHSCSNLFNESGELNKEKEKDLLLKIHGDLGDGSDSNLLLRIWDELEVGSEI